MVTAANGEEALRLALAVRPTLVLVDADDGGADPSELVSQIRATLPRATLVRVRYPLPRTGPLSDGDLRYDHVFDKPRCWTSSSNAFRTS